jgi:hypothetical protein
MRAPEKSVEGKLAVLIETRPHPRLLPVIDNFATHLPMEWRLQLFLSEENDAIVSKAHVLKDWKRTGRIIITRLSGDLHTIPDYNALLQSERFWQRIRGDNVLIFQTDSVLCRSALMAIDDFLGYDYVGSPWDVRYSWAKEFNGICGNGGLSLRSKAKSLQAVRTITPDRHIHEDIWFCRAFMKLGAKFPPREHAMRFGVETVFFEFPLGVHKPILTYMNDSHLAILHKNCPESMMVPYIKP